jgi:hypothetical protein
MQRRACRGVAELTIVPLPLRDWREEVERTTVERRVYAPLAWAPHPDNEVLS